MKRPGLMDTNAECGCLRDSVHAFDRRLVGGLAIVLSFLIPGGIAAFFPGTCFAQGNMRPDTLHLFSLVSHSLRYCESSEYKHALDKTNEALSLAGALGFVRGETHARYALGVVSIGQRSFDDAIEILTDVRQTCEANGYADLLPSVLCYLGIVHAIRGNPDEGVQLCDDALNLALDSGDLRIQALSQYHKGFIYRNRGSIDLALEHLSEAERLSGICGYTWCNASSHALLGTISGSRGAYSDAIVHFNAALQGWERLDNKINIANTNHYFGNVHFFQSKLTEALDYYLIALRLRQEIGDQHRIGDSFHDIGHIYLNQNKCDEALVNYQNALKIFLASGNKERIAKAYGSVGLAYTELGDMTKALENFEASIAMQQEIGDKTGLAISYNNLGRMYLAEENYALAEKHLLAGGEMATELGNKEAISQSYSHLANLYTQTDSLDLARQYADRSISICMETGSTTGLMWGYYFLARIDSAQGRYAEAYDHHKLYKAYADDIVSEEQRQTIAELEVRYETEKKDHEIEHLENVHEISALKLALQDELLETITLEKENARAENIINENQIELYKIDKELQDLKIGKIENDRLAEKIESDRQRDQLALINKEKEIQDIRIKRQTMLNKLLLGGVVLFTLLSFMVYHYYMTRQKLKLQTLRNRIASDLHDDVGSTLSSIAIFSDVAQQQSKEVIPLLDTIGESSRKMLDAMADIVWTINPENDQFEKIILRMRSYAYELLGAKRIEFDFTTDENIGHIKLPMDVRKNLYLIFKEATINMVKYAEADKALFAIKKDKDMLAMTIRDNGKGFDINRLTEGNGLKNMRKRAEEIGASLQIDSRLGEGTMIQLKVAV